MLQHKTYATMYEYLRRVEEVNVTEIGNYLKDEIPDDYFGAVLVMKVVHEVILVTEEGELLQQLFSPEKSLDKDGNPADGITIDGDVVIEGDKPTLLTTIFNDNLEPSLAKRVANMLDHSLLPEEFDNVS